MKAAVLPAVGAALVIEDLPVPKPRAGEVRLRVRACGVCHTDLHVVKGEVRFPVPCVLGHEVSGVVDEVGPETAGLEPGTPVVASFIMPCGRCRFCVGGRDDLCEPFFALNRLKGVLYDGESRLQRADGSALAMYSMAGLAEYCVVPVTDVFRVPAGLPLEAACILGCAIMTAYGALEHQAALRPAETVAVVGIGGVGSNLLQLARVAGAARVIAVDVRPEKLEAARGLGATDAVDASGGDAVAAVRALTGGEGVDVAFEALGRPETVTAAFRMVKDGGRAVVIGIAAGTTPAPIEITHLVRRGIRVQGSYGARVRTDMPRIIALAAAGRISVTQPITRRYRLDQADLAYRALDRGEITGRAIVVMDSNPGYGGASTP